MNKITNKEFCFSIAAFITGSALLTVFSLSVTGHETWISNIAAILISLAVVLIYASLIKRFPGSTLIDMTVIVFGKLLGTVFSALYLLFFILITAVNVRDLGYFFIGYIMPETPLWIINSLFLITCAFAVSKGIQNIMKLSLSLFILSSAAIIFNTFLLIKNMNFSNFFPLFVHSPAEYLHGTSIMTTIPLLETVMFIMLAPILPQPEKAGRLFTTGIILGGGTLLLLVIRDIAVLGSLVTELSLPSYEVVRMINVLDVFSRLEVLFGLALLTVRFFKASVMYWISFSGIQNILKINKPALFITITGLIIVFTSINIFPLEGQSNKWSKGWGPLILGIFEILIPILLLITAAIRKKRTKIE